MRVFSHTAGCEGSPGGETEVADLCQFLPAFRVQAGWLPLLFDKSTDTCRAGLDR